MSRVDVDEAGGINRSQGSAGLVPGGGFFSDGTKTEIIMRREAIVIKRRLIREVMGSQMHIFSTQIMCRKEKSLLLKSCKMCENYYTEAVPNFANCGSFLFHSEYLPCLWGLIPYPTTS